MPTAFHGADQTELSAVLAAGVDHGGNRIEPFADPDGGWPLRCCFNDSMPGDLLAIIAWSPFTWDGPYRETGPIAVHADRCPAPGAALTELPPVLDRRPMVLRPYSHDHRILYRLVSHVPEDRGVTAIVARLLDDPDVAEVHGRNRTGGCWAFTARRSA
jgi:hypothetical protein